MSEQLSEEAIVAAKKRRRRLFLVATVMACFSIVTILWGGPLLSGALFLSWPTDRTPIRHDLPETYEPRHKGYIDHATGLYVREDEDLVLRRTPPFALTRTYLSGDHVSRRFGVGTTNNAEWYLIGDLSDLTWAELILANGGRIHFDRISWGKSLPTAVFVHRSSPSAFYGSRLGWTGLDFVLRFQDGGLARFQGCGAAGTLCSLTLLRDGDGHVLHFQRDREGKLITIKAPTERMDLDYDSLGRISRARDDSAHEITYGYDARGRLAHVRDADGSVRSYEYNDRDEMLAIYEPGKRITNTFDAGGRVTRQVTVVSDSSDDHEVAREYVIEFKYTVSEGSVTETDVKQYDGTHTIYRFNPHHYVKQEIRDALGSHPITLSYERDWVGQFPLEISVRCIVDGVPVSASAPLEDGDEDQIKRDLILRTCRPGG